MSKRKRNQACEGSQATVLLCPNQVATEPILTSIGVGKLRQATINDDSTVVVLLCRRAKSNGLYKVIRSTERFARADQMLDRLL